MKLQFLSILFLAALFVTFDSFAQEETIKVEPENITLDIQGSQKINATVVDETGKLVNNREFRYYSRNRRALSVDSTGMIKGYEPGVHSVIILSLGKDGSRLRKDIEVKVNFAPITQIKIEEIPARIYAGTTIPLKVKILDKSGRERDNVKASSISSKPGVARVDAYNNLYALKTGKATITYSVDNIEGKVNVNVVPNLTSKIELTSDMEEARTGDVFHFEAKVLDNSGKEINDAPVTFSFTGVSDDVSSNASGLIKQDGRFVADEPGMYTVMAKSGNYAATKVLKINPRNIKRKVEFVGQGTVDSKHTSDFWVWEGVDGKDYAVTGTWGADGTAYFWDVSNPANMVKIDSVQVDARTVNDVKISEDGTICVISREGASNRKNGMVIIDVSNPADAKIISTYTKNLTGGVHNVFIYKNHVYALSAAQKYMIINIEDPKNPVEVGKFELDTRGHSIHDVWVEDGIAYSSNWRDGIQLVDVGNGIAGGSPSNPVQFASYAYPSGANHAAFPFKSQSADKFYVIGGDEIFPYGLNMDKPNIAGGFLHFVDFTDLDNPEEIARFEVPGAGSHNYWVKDDVLYVAFYNGGVRVVDISGELMGDLYKQGREIGWYIPADPKGYVANAPFTWGAQPYKGHVFMSDWNSGLWAIKVEPPKPDETQIEVK